MKKKLTFAVVIALTLIALLAAPAFAWDSKLVLENKDANWNPIPDDTFGVLKYDSSGIDFSYGLFAKGLEENTDYSLIYYADPWPGDNPGALITESTTNSKGKIPRWDEGVVDLDMSLPHPDDANYLDGAKIWLVTSEDYNGGDWTAWNPLDYLFETKLISYEKTTPVYEWAEDPYLGMEGTFTIELFGSFSSHENFSWSTGWNELPQILGEDVYITRTKNGTTITLEIPAGTEVSFPYRPGVFVTFLSVDVVNGEAVFKPKDMDFSEPCTLTINGETITFTEIRGGVPVL